MSAFRFVFFLTFSLLATGTAMAVSDAALTYFSQAEKAIERGDLATAKEKIQAGLRITQAEAVAAYRRVLAIDPGHVASNNNLGLLAMKREKFVDAISYFQRALTSQPDFAASQLNLGYCLIRSGKKTEGESQLQKLIARLPEGNPLREEARAVLAGKR